jgi:PilZ domain-containing protein
MTPEMRFECVLVSTDPAVLGTMDAILRDFSICSSVCQDPLKTGNWLGEGSTDLVVVDLDAVKSSDLLRNLGLSQPRQKPTVLAISATELAVPGVDVMVRKPVTLESGIRSVKAAYSRMLQDFRKHTRFALMTPVLATDENSRHVSLTVTNIGEGGVGLTTKEKLAIGSTLCFRITLPGLENEISIRARVLWTRQYGIAGCEFVHMPPFDVQLFHAWLESRYRIKQPLIAV